MRLTVTRVYDEDGNPTGALNVTCHIAGHEDTMAVFSADFVTKPSIEIEQGIDDIDFIELVLEDDKNTEAGDSQG